MSATRPSRPPSSPAHHPPLRVGKAEPSFIDMRVPSSELRVAVTGPGMLVDRLRLVTDLGILDGLCHPSLTALADELEAISMCGATGERVVPIEVVTNRLGASLEIGVGPMSMYETELVVKTRSGRPLDALLAETIASQRSTSFVAGLVPVAGAGHHEHSAHAGPHLDEDEEHDEATEAGEPEPGHGHHRGGKSER